MAVRNFPPIQAGGGRVSIVRRPASFVYGAYRVTWPRDYEQAPDLGFGRAQGYVADLGHRPARFGRRFINRAVNIDAERKTTTVEQTLDEADEELSGEPVVTRLVGPEAYGKLRPGVDLRRGDIVPVDVWNRVAMLPITGQHPTVKNGRVVWEYTVGGRLLVDRSGVDRRNADLERRIAQETADMNEQIANNRSHTRSTRSGLTGSWDGDIMAAITGSEGALGALHQADVVIDGKVEDLDDRFVPVKNLVDEQISTNGALRRTVTSMDGIVNGSNPPRVNSNLWKLNNDAWTLQTAFNNAQTAINNWTTSAIDVLDKRIPYTMTISSGSLVMNTNWGLFRIVGNNFRFEKAFNHPTSGTRYYNAYPCRVVFSVAVDALDSWAVFDSATLGTGTNAYENFTGHFQHITSASVTIYRTDTMPTIRLPQIT